jgi:hypothetical protein
MLDTWFEAVGASGKTFFRKRTIYDTLSTYWAKEIKDLSNCMLAGSAYGGLIAVTRDTRYIPKISPNSMKQTIFTHTSAGKPMGKFLWEDKFHGALLHMFWSDDELLVCISKYVLHVFAIEYLTDDVIRIGTVVLLDVFGSPVLKYELKIGEYVNEFLEDESSRLTFESIIACANWEGGIVFLTYHKGIKQHTLLKLWTVANVRIPNLEEVNEIEIEEELDETKRVDLTLLSPCHNEHSMLRIYVCYEISSSVTVFNLFPDHSESVKQDTVVCV